MCGYVIGATLQNECEERNTKWERRGYRGLETMWV